ncbi:MULTISPECIES: glycosyltransferase family 4 protein [unclassified Knoellia]|uniref:glycosyltransferase family 4 protein n=1 Tax=Knoellia altitudinis TaxID=3404795 RepID=UPI003623407C
MTISSAGANEVVIATLLRRDGATGVQSHIRDLLESGQGLGRQVSLVTPFDARSRLLTPVFALRHLLHPLSGSAGVWWYRQWHRHYLEAALRTHLRQAVGRRTIYAQDPVSAEAALHARTTERVVLVVHFNVSQADEWADKGEIARGGRLYDTIHRQEQRVLPAVDGLVFVSTFMREAVRSRLPEVGSVPSVVAPNFVRVTAPAGGLPDRDLVSLGSLEPRKNQGFLLEVLASAARRGHRYTLTVVGDGPDRPALVRQARSLGVGDLVEFAGFSADPRAQLRRHRVYCHAARMESFGIALIEAMAEGLPVVAAPVGGIPEIIRPGVNGELWPLDDAERAADVLVGLLSDVDRLTALGRAAHEDARTRFSDTQVVPELLAFLDGLAPRSAPS